MKKIVATILLIALLVVPTATCANARAIPVIALNVSFATTAVVSTVEIQADLDKAISAVIKLYQGNSCIATWNASDVGYLNFRSVKVVDKGYTYTLTVDATIDGTTYDTVSTSAYFD